MNDDLTDLEIEISEAISLIKHRYQLFYNIEPMIKFDGETVKYLLIECWCYNRNKESENLDRLQALCAIVQEATVAFPEAAPYLVEHLLEIMPYSFESTPELCWLHGYFAAIHCMHSEEDVSSVDFLMPNPVLTLEEIDNEWEGVDFEALNEALDELIEELENLEEDNDDGK